MLSTVAFLFLLVNSALSRGITSLEGAACLNVANNFSNFPFDCDKPDLAYKCRCQDKSFLGTVINCVETYAEDSESLAGAYKFLLDACAAQAHQKYQMVHVARIYDNATDYLINMTEIPQTSPLRNPVIIDSESYEQSKRSVGYLLRQRMNSTYFGYALYAYWGLVLVVATCVNVMQWCAPYVLEKIDNLPPFNWLRRHLLCPQLIKPQLFSRAADHQRPRSSGSAKSNATAQGFREVMYRLPLRVDALVLFIYFALIIVFSCIGYEVITPNTIFKCPKGQKYVDYADRTGILATTQLPLVFLFAGRNNPLTKITGMSYRTFQVFHKWTSRIAFILLLLHAAFYLGYVNARGDYIERWGLLKWRMANTGFTAVTITTLFGSFRRIWYEWFKYTHKVLLIVFVVGAWYHCLTLGWIEFLAVSYSFWAIEYVLRLAKIITTGAVLQARCRVLYETEVTEVKKKSKKEEKETDAEQILTEVPHSIRMEVNHSGWWKPFPGAYCWITFLRWNMFWEAHPFTVVTSTSEENFNQLVFIIRVKNGLTKRLAQFIAKQPGSECKISIAVEGPYGTNIPFKVFDHAVFVAGGVGMTVVYSIAMDLAQIFKGQVLRGQKTLQDKSITLVWMVPNFESVTLFREEIEKLKEFKRLVKLHIYVTRPLLDQDLQEIVAAESLIAGHRRSFSSVRRLPESAELKEYKTTRQHEEMREFLEELLAGNDGRSSVTIEFNERPEVEEALWEIGSVEGPTAIIACGPSNLNADVRVIAMDCMKRKQSVEYFEEELLW